MTSTKPINNYDIIGFESKLIVGNLIKNIYRTNF